jgi:hypothetical protein
MRMRTPFRIIGITLLMAALALAFVVPASASLPDRTYRVTITNLTRGQPLTPVAVATHRTSVDAFTVGEPASLGVKEIAENGNLEPFVSSLQGSSGVSEVVQGTFPLVPEGTPGAAMFPDSVTFEIHATADARRLSWVSMLICTNDGFTGVDGLKLPVLVGESVTAGTAGYDAGTEINTEDFADIVPPCQGLIGVSSGEAGTGVSNPALAEGGVIHHHPGIQGGADLVPAVHGWDVDEPVAEITVERIA